MKDNEPVAAELTSVYSQVVSELAKMTSLKFAYQMRFIRMKKKYGEPLEWVVNLII